MKYIIYLILLCVIFFCFSKAPIIDTFINASEITKSTPINNLNIPNVLNNALYASNMYDDEYWVIKPTGFSDIYNYEDDGGAIINNMAAIDRTTNITFKKLSLEEQKTKDILSSTITSNNELYTLVGLAINEYYNQYYLLYESQPAPNNNIVLGENLSYLNYHINSYLLAKMHNAKPEVLHNIGPRAKINIGDVVYLSAGTFQLGPLVIKSNKHLQK